jgi:hypothetical protein
MTKEELEKDILDGLKLSDIISKYGFGVSKIYRLAKSYNLRIPRRRKHNLNGRKFGRLTVIEMDRTKRNGSWFCQCECGKTTSVRADHLLNKTRSCGCFFHDLMWKGSGEISGDYWSQVKKHARIRNLEVKVSIHDAWHLFELQTGRCALSGVPISLKRRRSLDIKQTASLDRIDNNKGYIEGNVQWVHKIIQKMKCDLPQEEFVEFCKMVAKEQI